MASPGRHDLITAPLADTIELGVFSVGQSPGESQDYDEPLPPKYDDIANLPPTYDIVIATGGERSLSEHGGSYLLQPPPPLCCLRVRSLNVCLLYPEPVPQEEYPNVQNTRKRAML